MGYGVIIGKRRQKESGMGGGIFDFNHNDKLDFSEAMVAGGILGAFADEMMWEAERAERESKRSTWDDDDNEPNDDDGDSDEWFDDIFDGDD